MPPYSAIVVTFSMLYGVSCYASEDHKAWRFKSGVLSVNTAIVTTTVNSRSLIDCATKCAKNTSMVSLYYESVAKLCYCNHDLDANLGVSVTGPLVYGYPSLAYVVEASADGEKISTSTTPEACVKLVHQANSTDFFNSFPNLPHMSLNTYCPQFVPLKWVVFQRRQDGSESFARYWSDYVNGFGDPSGEFWLGLEAIHQMTRYNRCELNITMEAEPNHPILSFGYAHYDKFNLSGADDNYRLFVSGFSGNVGDCLTYHSGRQFTTMDADHDTLDTNCATHYQAAWWYGDCHSSSLNGQYFGGNQTSYADGVCWSVPWGYYYSLIKVEMKFRCLFGSI